MARSSATEETRATGSDAVDLEHALQPVRAAGPGRPIAVAVTIGAILAALVWQPWGRGGSPVVPPTPVAIVAGVASPAPSSPTTPPGPSESFSRGPRPDFRPPGTDTAVSLLDDEWTVVAFLAPHATASADEPWTSNGTGAAGAPGGSLRVLQQQLSYTLTPLDRPGEPDAACRAPGGYQHPAAAHLPIVPVAYLGVTFPGMSPGARVTAVALERSGVALKRLPFLIVPTNDTAGAGRYTVPASGVGGAVLFAMARQATLPIATYRFEIRVPGIAGARYLYACVEP